MGDAIEESAEIQLKDIGGGLFGSKAPALSGGDAALGWSATGLGHGDNLTITTDGTYNFTSKANAKPMYYWDAKDNSLNSSLLSRRSFTLQNGTIENVAIGDSPQSVAYVFGGINDPDFGAFEGPFDTSLDTADQDGAIMFASRRFNFSPADASATNAMWNLKMWRWWYQVGQNNTVLALGQNNVSGNPRITNERTTGNQYVDAAMGITKDQWTRDIVVYNYNSTAAALDGSIEWNANGVDDALINCSLYDNSYPNKLEQFYWPQQQQITNGWGDTSWRMYVGHWYFDDTRHAVVISDNSTWGVSGDHVIEVQVPTSWANSAITVSLRKGQLSGFSGKYLYVIDSSGIPVSSNGVLI